MGRKLTVAGFALVVVVACSVLSGTTIQAGASTTTSGELNCTGTGQIAFRPALTATNGSSVKGLLKFDGTGCSGGTPEPSEVKASGQITTMESTICSTPGEAVEGNVSFRAEYLDDHVPVSHMSEGDWVGTAVDGSWDTAIEGSVTGSYSSDAAVIEADFSTADETGSCTKGVHKVTFTATLEDF
jgi:hypothetical protein